MQTRLYTPQEVADLLRLRVETVYDYIRLGKLPALRLGNRYRVEKADLETFLPEKRSAVRPPTAGALSRAAEPGAPYAAKGG